MGHLQSMSSDKPEFAIWTSSSHIVCFSCLGRDLIPQLSLKNLSPQRNHFEPCRGFAVLDVALNSSHPFRLGVPRPRVLHVNAERPLQVLQVRSLALREECGSTPMFTQPPRAAHAMDEALGRFGQIIVDDVDDLLDVDTPRS